MITLPTFPELHFDEGKHLYTLDQNGVTFELPSVTQILRFISREIYGDVPQSVLDKAADKGTRVHEAIEAYDNYGWKECEPDTLPYILAYEKWVQDHNFQTVANEYPIYHRTRLYAGRIDRIFMDEGKLSLLDIKTSETILEPLVAGQLYGYSEASKSHGINVVNHYILHLKPDASYDFIKVDIQKGFRIFEACAFLHGVVKKGDSA